MTAAVIGHGGMLGRVVARRWAEHGAEVLTTELRYTGTLGDPLVEWAAEADIVVNCALSRDPALMLVVNGLLPLHLAAVCGQVIQPSTDAINEDTAYALSKRIGDRADGLVLRASLASEHQPPDLVPVNWTWNGVTTLTWADVAWEYRNERGVVTLSSPVISRYELAATVARIFGYPEPTPWVHPITLDRAQAGVAMPPIRRQLEDLRAWLA